MDAKRGELASLSSRTGQKPAIKPVSFDPDSGIKTVFMADGTVHEEPIDSSTATKLSAEPAGAGLTSLLDQVREAAHPQ